MKDKHAGIAAVVVAVTALVSYCLPFVPPKYSELALATAALLAAVGHLLPQANPPGSNPVPEEVAPAAVPAASPAAGS